MTHKILSSEQLSAIRSLYPHTAKQIIYMNHASTGPLSTRVTKTLNEYLQDRSAGAIETYKSDMRTVISCKSALQQLIHAELPDRIAFVPNTTEGINIIAGGLNWKSGDRILLNDMEFPANVYPYFHLRQKHVELDFLQNRDGRITPDMVESALTSRTRLVALSAVQFLTGHKADLEAIGKICRSKNVWFVVDGIQALGAVAIDVQSMHIDALASGGHKWLMAPHGTGFLYLTEELQSAIHQQNIGWLSVDDPWQFNNYHQELADSARRYEGGSLNIPGIIGLSTAVQTILEIGIQRIESHIIELTRILIEQLQELNNIQLVTPLIENERGGIVTVRRRTGEFPLSLLENLEQNKIFCAVRNKQLRFSPHFYNNPEEVETVIAALKNIF
jgi:selenocysteine lyase/cysteine desulfurase